MGYVPGGGGSQPQQQTDAQVFWGYQGPSPQEKVARGLGVPAGPGGQKPVTLSATTAAGYLYQLAQEDPKQLNAYRDRMIKAGVLDPDNASFAAMQNVWQDALSASATAYASGTMLAPWDAIDLLGAGGKGKGAAGGETKFTGTKTSTSRTSGSSTNTSRNVDLSSASEARAFLLAAAENELGRAATADEIAAFRRALNGEEKANADVKVSKERGSSTSTATANIVDGETVSDSTNTTSTSSSDTTTSGGMDRGQYALDYARSADDWAEHQLATTYMNTLFASLGSPTEVGTN